MSQILDLTGQKYGKLTVKKRAPDIFVGSKNKRTIAWYCDCDCGTKDFITTTNKLRLKNQKYKSCGCLNKENQFKPSRNKYIVNDEYATFYTSKGEEFYVDIEDIDIVKERTWYANGAYICDRDGVMLHRLIMNPPKNMDVDHINHNTFDNRKSNLRIVSECENMWNRALSKNNTSGVTGVFADKTGWIATIGFNNQQIRLGHFKDKNDAIKARKDAEEKYYGKYSYDNSMKGVS